MRDINRIDNICGKLADLWKELPDWRLGQLFNNFQCVIQNDCFYIEDDELIGKLEEYVKSMKE